MLVDLYVNIPLPLILGWPRSLGDTWNIPPQIGYSVSSDSPWTYTKIWHRTNKVHNMQQNISECHIYPYTTKWSASGPYFLGFHGEISAVRSEPVSGTCGRHKAQAVECPGCISVAANMCPYCLPVLHISYPRMMQRHDRVCLKMVIICCFIPFHPWENPTVPRLWPLGRPFTIRRWWNPAKEMWRV